MLASDFARSLKKLNRNLRVYCGDNAKRAACVYFLLPNGQAEDICGVDKNIVPERATFDEQGHVLKGGWRRVLNILITEKLCTKERAAAVFNTHFDFPPQRPPKGYKTKVQKAIDELRDRSASTTVVDPSTGKKVFSLTPNSADLVDVARMIREEKSC